MEPGSSKYSPGAQIPGTFRHPFLLGEEIRAERGEGGGGRGREGGDRGRGKGGKGEGRGRKERGKKEEQNGGNKGRETRRNGGVNLIINSV